jgi:hypothetical protein
VADDLGPLLRELAIQARITLVVGVPLHLQAHLRLLVQDRHQGVQAGPRGGQQIGTALREIQVRPNYGLPLA